MPVRQVTAMPHIEIDGFLPSPDQLAATVLDGYSHFTAMQVRNLLVRGLDLHLKRLQAANQELFGTALDLEAVKSHIRHALSLGVHDASVRVYVRQPEDQPVVMVTVREPAGPLGGGQPWRLQSVPYQRAVAHIKRARDFGQAYFQRRVQQDGFDEALLTGPGGVICEGTITNIGFIDGSQIVWPSAPMLAGITMQLIDLKFGGAGIKPGRSDIRITDIGRYNGAFVCNAHGITPVGQIDDVEMPLDQRWMTMISRVYESVEWDRL
jgi:branched-subunit amino acid aminotransferase/4-amino-4-deoxychorismate lyase